MIYLVGCDHYLQPYDLAEIMMEVKADERAMKEKFYSILEEIINTKDIKFVGEECKADLKTIPRSLAGEHGCAYAEIDMPVEERRKAGIPDGYDRTGGEVRAHGMELREQYMVARSMESDENPKLIVCGAEHIEGLKAKFETLGRQVEARNVIVEAWFDPPWAKMARGEL